jgi:5-methyltetrahydrofolate--homocysteine methyltransferase
MDFVQLLESRPLVVGDGAMGSQLMDRGLDAGECGERWNLERPDAVEEVQRGYVEAGADFLITNTFGANAVALERHGLGDMLEDLNRAGVEVARGAAGDAALVLGGLGPTGAMLEPYGALSADRAREAFSEQARALSEAGVDAIICETFESSEELRVALEAAGEACDLPLLASMKFAREASGRYRTMMGDAPESLVEVAAEAGCAALGSNCGKGIEIMVPLAAKLRGLSDLPILVEPNAGVPQLVHGETVYPEGPEVFDEHLPELFEAGARIVGGCCGTTAGHIRAVRGFADRLGD